MLGQPTYFVNMPIGDASYRLWMNFNSEKIILVDSTATGFLKTDRYVRPDDATIMVDGKIKGCTG